MTAYVTDVCQQCGNLRSVCSDPERPWYPQRAYCYASASTAATWRKTHELYDHPKGPDPHVLDGLMWWMALDDLTPEDDFLDEKRLLDGLSVGSQQSAGDEH